MKNSLPEESEGSIGRDSSKEQLLKYAEDIAWLYETERTERKALELANKQLQLEIAQRRDLQEDLVQSEARYRSLFEESVEAIYITTRDGIVVDANDACVRLLGYEERGELVGESVLKTYADPSARLTFRQQIERDGSVKDFAVKLCQKDGTIIDCLITGTVCKGRGGKIVGYQGLIRDVTEQERRRKILELAGRMEALAHMAGGIAHEIRNPLAISSTAAQMLANSNLPPALRKQCSEKIITGINRASAIIENLLVFATPLDVHAPEETDLVTVISEALKAISPSAISQEVKLVYQLNRKRLLIMGSTQSLYQAFLNLFSNAMAAMPDGGVLLVMVDANESKAMVTITDSGQGIPEEHVSRIFDPFFPGLPNKGLGLGLSVTYSIVLHHKGTIEVDNVFGKGTSFRVELPLFAT